MTFEKEPLTVGGQRVGTIATHGCRQNRAQHDGCGVTRTVDAA